MTPRRNARPHLQAVSDAQVTPPLSERPKPHVEVIPCPPDASAPPQEGCLPRNPSELARLEEEGVVMLESRRSGAEPDVPWWFPPPEGCRHPSAGIDAKAA
jgi:hypothetical protein